MYNSYAATWLMALAFHGRRGLMQDFKFRPGKHGKPLLVTEGLPRRVRDYDFNLTNTRGLIGLAVAAGAKVGIDCERLDRKFKFPCERLAKRMLSVQEREELLGVEPSAQPTVKVTHSHTMSAKLTRILQGQRNATAMPVPIRMT